MSRQVRDPGEGSPSDRAAPYSNDVPRPRLGAVQQSRQRRAGRPGLWEQRHRVVNDQIHRAPTLGPSPIGPTIQRGGPSSSNFRTTDNSGGAWTSSTSTIPAGPNPRRSDCAKVRGDSGSLRRVLTMFVNRKPLRFSAKSFILMDWSILLPSMIETSGANLLLPESNSSGSANG
jgi:hypothetical protein